MLLNDNALKKVIYIIVVENNRFCFCLLWNYKLFIAGKKIFFIFSYDLMINIELSKCLTCIISKVIFHINIRYKNKKLRENNILYVTHVLALYKNS